MSSCLRCGKALSTSASGQPGAEKFHDALNRNSRPLHHRFAGEDVGVEHNAVSETLGGHAPILQRIRRGVQLAYAAIGGHVHTRFRSPYGLSTRPTAGQNLCSLTHASGNPPCSRG